MKTDYLHDRKIENIKSIKVVSVVASLFSVFFSLSIVREYSVQNSELFLIVVLSLFTFMFLIFNEYMKVRELRNYFSSSKNKRSIIIPIITVLISISLSSTGIYFWTNKTFHIEKENRIEQAEKRDNIISKHNAMIDTISSIPFENTKEYNRISSEVEFWRNRRAVSLDERALISENMANLMDELIVLRNRHDKDIRNRIELQENRMGHEVGRLEQLNEMRRSDTNRHNSITLIFLVMIVITEFIIIFIARLYSYHNTSIEKFKKSGIAKEYLERYKVMTDIILRNKEIEINEVKYSRFLSSESRRNWDNGVKPIYGLFKELGITGSPLKEAQRELNKYYNNLIKIDNL